MIVRSATMLAVHPMENMGLIGDRGIDSCPLFRGVQVPWVMSNVTMYCSRLRRMTLWQGALVRGGTVNSRQVLQLYMRFHEGIRTADVFR